MPAPIRQDLPSLWLRAREVGFPAQQEPRGVTGEGMMGGENRGEVLGKHSLDSVAVNGW